MREPTEGALAFKLAGSEAIGAEPADRRTVVVAATFTAEP